MTQIKAPEGTRSPAVLETVDGARAIVIRLAPGQELGDHQVRERAWLTVVEGETRIEAGGVVVKAGPGTLVKFEPGERHSVAKEREQIRKGKYPWATVSRWKDERTRGVRLASRAMLEEGAGGRGRRDRPASSPLNLPIHLPHSVLNRRGKERVACSCDGRCWARTSDLLLVRQALSQLS